MRARGWCWWLLALLGAPAPARAQRTGGLAAAAADGARALASARLDRLADMATADLAPLDDAAWPDGSTGQETAWERCEITAPAAPVDLRASRLLPVQVSVASRGDRAAALVSLGRPGGERHGLAFPESRWVAWEGAGAPSVRSLRGFFPGASLALRGDGTATVLSYVRPEPTTPEQRASHLRDVDIPTRVAITQLGPDGAVAHGPNEVEFTDGWDLDSNAAAWRYGTAVVLGRATNPPEDRRRHEVIHFLDARGHPVRPALELTDQAREDGLGAALASLAAAPDERTLAAAWTVPTGPLAGVWVRRGIALDALPFRPGTAHIEEPPPPAPGERPRRAPQWFPRGLWVYRAAEGRGFWGPAVTRGGVTFQRLAADGEGAPASELFFSSWPAARRSVSARALGTWADPLPVWSPGGAVVAGLAPGSAPPALTVRHFAERERALRSLELPLARLPGLAGAADVALCPTADGALLVWIDAPADGERTLSSARIACQRAPGAQGATSPRATERPRR